MAVDFDTVFARSGDDPFVADNIIWHRILELDNEIKKTNDDIEANGLTDAKRLRLKRLKNERSDLREVLKK